MTYFLKPPKKDKKESSNVWFGYIKYLQLPIILTTQRPTPGAVIPSTRGGITSIPLRLVTHILPTSLTIRNKNTNKTYYRKRSFLPFVFTFTPRALARRRCVFRTLRRNIYT